MGTTKRKQFSWGVHYDTAGLAAAWNSCSCVRVLVRVPVTPLLVLLGKQHMDGGPGAWTLPPTWETWVEVQAPGVSPVLSLAIAGI